MADPAPQRIILVHGFTNTADIWWASGIAQDLARDHRVIALDLRGHGKSDKPKPPVIDAEMARDVARLMAHLGIRRAHIVGYGLGANIAAHLATLHPERFITMTLAGGAHVPARASDDRKGLGPVPKLVLHLCTPALEYFTTKMSSLPRLTRFDPPKFATA